MKPTGINPKKSNRTIKLIAERLMRNIKSIKNKADQKVIQVMQRNADMFYCFVTFEPILSTLWLKKDLKNFK